MELRKKTRDIFRRAAAFLLCAAMLLALAACGSDGERKPAKLRETGATFTIAVAQTPDSFNPLKTKGGLTEEFFLLCYDPLWRLDEKGEPVSCLAKDWSLSSDHLTWTIRLRRDATFSDGTPVTAQDVAFSYDLMRRNDTIFTDYMDGITAIRCPDKYTVVISTEYVKGDMLYNPTPILPKRIWQDYEFNVGGFENASMIGSGPFVYDASRSGEEGWVFRSRAEHFGGTAQVKEIVFSYYSTVNGAARAVSAGNADASFGLTDVQLTTLESVPGVELIQAVLPSAECRMLVLNLRSSFFKLENLRKLAEYCTDRTWFLSMASGGAGRVGSSFMSPGLDVFLEPSGLRSFDQQKASEILASASYRDVDGDGIVEYGVRDAKLTLGLYTSSQDAWASTAATILQEDMLEIGAKVSWHKTDKAVTEVCRPKDSWDMCFYTFRGAASPVVTAARFLNGPAKLAGWEDAGASAVMEALRSAEDTASVYGYARQLEQLVYDACPVVVLAYSADVQAIRSDAWTGYEDILARGGLFHTGSAAIYLGVTPLTAAK